MAGDLQDMQSRLRALLPLRWFGDVTPNLDSLLAGLATPWSWIYSQIQNAAAQARISTATGGWLDLAAADFFGTEVSRYDSEADSAYRARIKYLLFRAVATRSAVANSVEYLTGQQPWIFEPARPSDAGCYGNATSAGSGIGTSGYGCAGGWGNLDLPFQFFMTVNRPIVTGLSLLPGYSQAGAGYGIERCAYADLTSLPGALSDQEIFAFVHNTLPIGVTAWVRIQ